MLILIFAASLGVFCLFSTLVDLANSAGTPVENNGAARVLAFPSPADSKPRKAA